MLQEPRQNLGYGGPIEYIFALPAAPRFSL
jgi:hypothetical protein